MNIRQKSILVIALSLTISALLNFVVLRLAIFPSFVKLEHERATDDVGRVLSAIQSQISEINNSVKDNSNWSDCYSYAHGQRDGFIEEYINADVMRDIDVQFLLITNRDGSHLFEATYFGDEAENTAAQDMSATAIDPAGALLVSSDDANPTGLLMTTRGPLLVASRPILRGNGEGPYAGSFVMGRLLDERQRAAVSDETRVPFRLLPAVANQLDAEAANAFALLRGGKDVVIDETAADTLAAYALLRDLNGQPALLVQATIQRGITQAGMRALRVAVGGIILAGVIVIGVMVWLLQVVLVGPISHLTDQLLAIGRSGDLSRRATLSRRDEIGLLSQEFDAMLEKLGETRNRLLEQSYSAGIAEMAAGVLHNIRNQLAPLSLRLGRLQQALDQSTESKLGRAFDELKSATLPAERKQKVLQYVELSCRNATDRQHNTVSELKGIADDLVRIEHVLQDLDRFSRKDDAVAEVHLIDLVRETVDVLPKFPDIEVVIRIDPRMEDCPVVATDPFILRHVLQNLIVNAIESMMAAGKQQGTIGIRAIATTGGAGPAMDLQVEDDGIGIPADKLDTIFVRGFSTKQGNRRGTGLHWCANSMLAIGGRVFAESPGAGCGATMHLIVPVPPAAKRAAA